MKRLRSSSQRGGILFIMDMYCSLFLVVYKKKSSVSRGGKQNLDASGCSFSVSF